MSKTSKASTPRKACVVTKNESTGKDVTIVDILVLIGAILGIILGIFDIFFPIGIGWNIGHYIGIVWVWGVIWGIAAIVISIVLLSTAGFIESVTWKVSDSWIAMFVLGLIMLIPTANYGGAVVVVAAIVKIFCKD